MYLGAHIDVSKDILKEVKRIKHNGGNIVQLFLTSPGNRLTAKKHEPILKKFKDYINKNNMKCVVHASYILNLAKDWDNHSWWLKNLELELEYANKINAIGVVVHCGNKMNLSKKKALDNMYSGINYVLNKTSKLKTKIIIETSSGQGSELCSDITELAKFYKRFKNNKRVKICIDTCHVFAAGYDITNKEKIVEFIKVINKLIGFKNVALIHLNDSKNDRGEKKDRHESIGKGKIGLNAIKLLTKIFMKFKIPIVLETPRKYHKYEIKILQIT